MSDWQDLEDVNIAEEEAKQKELLICYGQIFSQMLESEKFRGLFNVFFTLNKIVDESEKTVTFRVIENPPEVIAKKLFEAQQADTSIEVVDTDKAKKLIEKLNRTKK